MVDSARTIRVVLADPACGLGARAVRAYMEEVVGRYWGRAATPAEIEQAMREEPSDDLLPPRGLLVVALLDGQAVGCGGLRLGADRAGELTRVWVASGFRRQGLGTRIVTRLENEAAGAGCTRVRLDTRSDLTEARALYRKLGYAEVAPFNQEKYAQHWLEKSL